MKKTLLLFDVDGTIAESGCMIDPHIEHNLNEIDKKLFEIGVVGGGTFEKIKSQIGTVPFTTLFCECGSSCYVLNPITKEYKMVYCNNLFQHPVFSFCQQIIKESLQFIVTNIPTISGHFIDVRNGLVYISLVGLQATTNEKQQFIQLDYKKKFRENLFRMLQEFIEKNNIKNKIRVTYGGSTGIAVYPVEWDKVQVLDHIPYKNYEKIFYFADKYEQEGNDFRLINHPLIHGVRVSSIKQTRDFLQVFFL